MKDSWKPEQYERFKAERSQPFYDLLDLLEPVVSPRAIDLGCGTGELTRELHERTGAVETLGLDSSAAMLERAKTHESVDGLHFSLGKIEDLPKGSYDIVFSNAAIQWVSDHPQLLARLAGLLKDGGQIAIQLPANFDHPSHVTAADLAGREPYRAALAGYQRPPGAMPPERYAEILHRLGFTKQQVFLRVYGHVIPSREGVLEWVKGTLLTDYEKRMPADLFARFLVDYWNELRERLEDTKPYFYPFKRILFWAKYQKVPGTF